VHWRRMTPQETFDKPLRRPGRLRAAWLSLRGRTIVEDQFRAEWQQHLLELSTVYDKLYGTVQRLYQRDKKALESAISNHSKLLDGVEPSDAGGETASRWATKAELSRRAFALEGISIPRQPINGGENVATTEGE